MNTQQLKDAIKAANELKKQAKILLDDTNRKISYYDAVIVGLQTALDGETSTTTITPPSNLGGLPTDLDWG
jgi:hypothetical protein